MSNPRVLDPMVVDCPDCEGMTFRLVPCRCRADQSPTDDTAAGGEPYPECRLCAGVGGVAVGCNRCGQTGRRRAQLVLTMANLDTGAVASHNVVPGGCEPTPDQDGGWWIELTPLVSELAATVGVTAWRSVLTGAVEPVVRLPRQWRPHLPAGRRLALEAKALAGHSRCPWQVYLGHSDADAAAALVPPDLDRGLDRLCAIAGLLCLDLVVEARRTRDGGLTWSIGYRAADAEVPAEPGGEAADLREAVAATTVRRALDGVVTSRRPAPASAYLVQPSAVPTPRRPTTELDQLERRIVADCARPSRRGDDVAGAQAIWRDGRWCHTVLRVAGTSETTVRRETGQTVRRISPVLRRDPEPPAPSWQGEPITELPCPDCDPASGLQVCHCALAGQRPEPGCPFCDGTGQHRSVLPCPTCAGTHRIHSGLVVTITDLRVRAVHLNWRAGDPVDVEWLTLHPDGRPVVRLPARHQLATWADTFRVRPEDLTELDGGHPIDQDLLDGIVTLPAPDADVFAQHLRAAGPWWPSARLLVLAARPAAPPLANLIRLALGLGLNAIVTVENHRYAEGNPLRVHGEWWSIELGTPGRTESPMHPTLEAAIAYALEYLDIAVLEAVPTDPGEPLVVPQSAAASPVASDPTVDPASAIRWLGEQHPGQAVTVQLDSRGCRVFVPDGDRTGQVIVAADLAAALDALGLDSS
ncbi:hypothetical protein [Micromonospora polyrhachis]|uniref:Uncharacterized protein n=1 Tax=Micromonospora polyrhachis TaxID=1282883 RepID=A0A7W7WPD8_9ACTN|nr:hypothetical protein [Micromonospora polyrhachis]MBB4958579.1 hypothetical protein [Micromonospora polyrhachis]